MEGSVDRAGRYAVYADALWVRSRIEARSRSKKGRASVGVGVGVDEQDGGNSEREASGWFSKHTYLGSELHGHTAREGDDGAFL